MENAAMANASSDRGHRKVRTGVVVSDKMNKTVVVKLERKKLHARYKKYIKVWNQVKAHDEENTCRAGDLVEIMETRPLSKDKHWRVTRVLRKSEE